MPKRRSGRPLNKDKIPDAELIDLIRRYGCNETAKRLDLNRTTLKHRRNYLEGIYRISIRSNHIYSRHPTEYPWRKHIEIRDGIIIICGDAHYWPGPPSLMHRALVLFCKEYKPKAVVHIGDVLDFPAISRHARIGWEAQPEPADEIEAAKERLSEIEKAAFKAQKIWTLGNHDGRFETRLAAVAPQYARVHGVHLKDHFPNWETAWSCWVNDTLVAKHRCSGGLHDTHNSTLKAGKNIATGHRHSAKVTPYTDYNGTRYGVDVGCIADVDHRAFVDYTEDSPKNWRSAFGVFTFRDSKLLQPELVMKWDEKSVQFRGDIFVP